MKHKYSKRSISNKQTQHRSYQTQTRRLSTPIDHIRTISPNKIDLGTGTVLLDSYTSCLKPNVPLKSQKILKRDLLRCSNQRPSLLGSQTLQPPRIHHGLQQTHSVASPSSSSSSSVHQNAHRHRSLSTNSHTFHTTIDRIGPWPDISINRLRSDGNDLLRPLKNFRNNKNPRLFSPKYYSALNDNTNKFIFHPSKRTYIEEYRKQKGYLLNINSKQQQQQNTSLSLSSSTQLDDDQLSTIGTYSGGAENCTTREQTDFSTTNLSLSTRGITKSSDDIPDNRNQINILPAIPIRNNNNHIRSNRHTQHHQTITLPPLPTTSFPYLNSMSSVAKAYSNNKKTSIENQSKLYFIDGRQKKRTSERIHSCMEVTSHSQNYPELQTTSRSAITETEQSKPVTVYQLLRRTSTITV